MNLSNLEIVLIGGAAGTASAAEKALQLLAGTLVGMGCAVKQFSGPSLDLPMYAPENPRRTPQARAIVEALREADGIVLAADGVHGAMSGRMKNVLDYVEDMSRDDDPYFHDRPVGLIATAVAARDVGTVLLSLRAAVHALRGWPTPLGVAINDNGSAFDTDGNCLPQIAEQLHMLAEQVVKFSEMSAASRRAFIEQATTA